MHISTYPQKKCISVQTGIIYQLTPKHWTLQLKTDDQGHAIIHHKDSSITIVNDKAQMTAYVVADLSSMRKIVSVCSAGLHQTDTWKWIRADTL